MCCGRRPVAAMIKLGLSVDRAQFLRGNPSVPFAVNSTHDSAVNMTLDRARQEVATAVRQLSEH